VSLSPAILGADGRPVTAERVRVEKQQAFNPLRNWTPDILTMQLEAYARGHIANLAWVMEWLEKHDDIIATVAPKAKAAVSRYGFDVMARDEIRPEHKQLAEDQRGRLQAFWDGIEVGDALELEEIGGFRLLVQQVMDAYGKGYAAHHIQWRPSANGLSARFTRVPAWFWEATTGRLRFLESKWAQYGVEREKLGGSSAWMISKGRAVLLAGVIARMFKQLPLQDWLTFCDRHGMPAFLGKTSATKGTDGWLQMLSAVQGIGSEFGAVVNTSDTIEVLNLSGSGEVPYEKLIDRMDRAQVMLWRGGDLSTISRQDGTGSNPQQEDSDELDADNAVWVGETLDRQITRRVISYYFGDAVPVLVKTQLRTKTRQNVTQDLTVVKEARTAGVRVSKPWFLSKFGVVEADANEAALGETAAPKIGPAPTDASNSAEPTDAEKLLTDSLAKALGVQAGVLKPVQELIHDFAGRLQERRTSDAEWLDLVEEAALSLPELFDPAQADELAADLSAAMGAATLQGIRDALRESKSPAK